MDQSEKNALLEEAKRRYPVGTKFKCLVTRDTYTIPDNITFRFAGTGMYSYHESFVFHQHYDLRNGRWAEIVSKPEVKEESVSEPELGKWYIDCRTWKGEKWYIKLTEYSLQRVDGETIKPHKRISYSAACYWTNTTMIQNIELLTDLTEIQQYLPEGHPDKFPVKQKRDDTGRETRIQGRG
jgi:hypothetical protein